MYVDSVTSGDRWHVKVSARLVYRGSGPSLGAVDAVSLNFGDLGKNTAFSTVLDDEYSIKGERCLSR